MIRKQIYDVMVMFQLT